MTDKDKDEINADCYSSEDRSFMEKTRRFRARILGPLLKWLKDNKFQADSITFAALICGLLFTPLFLYSPLAAIIALLLHALLDGIDGPLARLTRSDSAKGSITDTFSDQIVVATSSATLIMTGYIHPLNGTAYIFLYTLVVIFAMIRNAMGIPYKRLIRPRFLVYLCIPVSVYAWKPALDLILIICNIPLLVFTISGYHKIRHNVGKKKD